MDPETKLNLLSQYVIEKPKHVLENFLLMGTEDAYQSAKALLHERYGTVTLIVSSTFVSKLEAWPNIEIKNADSLRDFSDFLLD